MTTTMTRPPTAKGTGRLAGIDVARAVAVIGMFAAHFNPGQLDPHDPLRAVVSGRSAVLFAVLAGIAVVLLIGAHGGRAPRRGARWGLAARAVVLFGLGLGLSALGTTVKEILTVYAVLFVLAVPLSGLSTRTLSVLAAVWMVVGPALSFALRAGPLPPAAPGHSPDPAALLSGREWLETAQGLLIDGPYPVLTWAPFLLVGMLVARTDLTDARTARWMLLGGAASAGSALLVSWVALDLFGGWGVIAAATGTGPATVQQIAATPVGAVATDHPLLLLTAAPHSGTPVEILASSGIAVTVIGVCLLSAARWPRGLVPLAATGRLALSAYAAHIILIALIGLPGMVALLTAYGYGLLLLVVTATPLLALGWMTWVGRGPLERLVGRASRTVEDLAAPRGGQTHRRHIDQRTTS